MGKLLVEIEQDRFFLNDTRKYMVRGVFPKECEIKAYLDTKELPLMQKERASETIAERVEDLESQGYRRMDLVILLPEEFRVEQKLILNVEQGGRMLRRFRFRGQELMKKRGRPQYYIDEEHVDHSGGYLSISGWCASESPAVIRIFDDQKHPVRCQIKRQERADVQRLFEEYEVDDKTGFSVEMYEIPDSRYLYIVMRAENGSKSVYKMGLGKKEIFLQKIDKYGKKGINYFQANGGQALVQKTLQKCTTLGKRPKEYSSWLKKHRVSPMELEKQKKEHFSEKPLISLVVPVYKTKPEYLEQLIRSVKKQSYKNWEICFSDGNGSSSPMESVLKKYEVNEPKIHVRFHKDPVRTVESLNDAIALSTGDLIAFAGCEDILEPNAFYEMVRMLNENPKTDFIYSDEDQMNLSGKQFYKHHFKPDFNLDLLCTTNYIDHLAAVKRELVEKADGFRTEFEGAEFYDFYLRCAELAEHISHIPKILYHSRRKPTSGELPEGSIWDLDAGRRAVQAHFDRIGVKAEVMKTEQAGIYRTRYLREHDPLISILIPNKDHIEDLERCIASVEAKSTYPNYEYIIIENNSTEEETFQYYKELEKRNPKVKVVYWDGPFNYSDINNFGAAHAGGEYYILLNNDTEVINPDWMEEMLGFCMRRDVGIVGARLFYEDDTVQHAGVILGFGNIAGHAFVQQPRSNTGYHHRIVSAQNYSAVTAACLMVRKDVFEEVGGLSSDLAVAFNDVDFCLKVQDAGYLVVYNPYVQLYHYESKSRGLEDTPEKKARYGKEIETLKRHWPDVFRNPDPYYNRNLTLERQDFSL